MRIPRRPLIIALGLLIVGAVFWNGIDWEGQESETTSLSDIMIEVADTEAEQERGLSGRSEIPKNYGMLFVFPDSGKHGFWMKDMKAPIDIIWIKDTGEIVGIEEAVQPETYPAVFYPPEPVSYVLEVAAGESRYMGFWIGKKLDVVREY